MEEGVPPLPPRSEPCSNATLGADVTDPSTAIVPFNKATYVIQVPKEQILRVPPPENARIVEEHRNMMKTRQKTPSYCSRLAYILMIILVLVLLCLFGFLTFYLVATPGSPNFTVNRIAVVGPSLTRPNFGITMRAQNPSTTMDFHYKNGGKVDLSYKGKLIASGDAENFDIGHEDTTKIKLSLQGSKGGLPKGINTGPKGLKNVVPLSLSADFPVKLGFGALRMRNKELNVRCDIRVSNWGKEMRVVSQTCKAN